MDFLIALIPFIALTFVAIFIRPLYALFIILTGNKEGLHQLGSFCKEPIPFKDQYYTMEEMGYPDEPAWKRFKILRDEQLKMKQKERLKKKIFYPPKE